MDAASHTFMPSTTEYRSSQLLWITLPHSVAIWGLEFNEPIQAGLFSIASFLAGKVTCCRGARSGFGAFRKCTAGVFGDFRRDDPYVWSGRALQENLVELAVSGTG